MVVVVSVEKKVYCEAEKEPHVKCGAWAATRTPTGWIIICPRCKEKIVLDF